MSSQSDEFQVLLPSNVNGNPRNKPYQYKTELAKPLDLPGEWDVALINISYPHNWTNLVKPYQFFIMRMRSAENANDVKFAPDPTNDEQDLFAAVTKPGELQNWEVADSYTIRRGNYDIETIIELITNSFNKIYVNKTIGLKINLNEYRVKIYANVPVAIACYAGNSVLQLLGFGSQSTQLKIQGKRYVEFMIIFQYRTIQANLPPSLK